MILSSDIPIPLSFILNLILTISSVLFICCTLKFIFPFSGVNFIALLNIFDNTCLILVPSEKRHFGIFLSISNVKSIFLSIALLEKSSKLFSHNL